MSETEPSDQEESISWLRDRGVLIEFPHEADKAGRKKAVSTGKTSKICIVKIPCDEREPFKEIEIPVSDDQKGDQLLELLLIYFNNSRLDTSVIDGLQKNQTTLFGTESVAVKESTLQALGQKGSMKAFNLSRPCSENNYLGVSFYLDEIGQIKQLVIWGKGGRLGLDNLTMKVKKRTYLRFSNSTGNVTVREKAEGARGGKGKERR